MRERDVRKMLRQDVRGEYVLRPLDEFIVTHTRKQPEHELWTFSSDEATLHLRPPGLPDGASPRE